MVLLCGAPHRVAVAVAHPVALIHEIQMRVDLQDMDRPTARKGADAGDVDRMIAADHDRQCARVEDRAHAGLDIGVAFLGIGMHDVGIADIDDGHVGAEVDAVILVVIGPGMAEGEQRGCLAHRARAEARPGAELRAEVERRAQDGDIGVDCAPVLDIATLAEGRDADKGQVQASGLIGMGHRPVSCVDPGTRILRG